ncbi:19S proteasome regulatory subunit Rpn6 [Schizosaccharomyces cryophilus OY26]|uniref:19S proteasome regulatory subunit Rpn6 n=1 Tax=Schizosaccharomyces cryophilus (strain OY26 / ATCC MYA-4695 / CBS 11777 / NBRC 106824 / NRRL Y48691) TaxID=653667 RepID=S9X107_SCHCR|nr:19S proteasome regulatory subunit Rpn6 [Schizosaccharomyces cryophilus OY26]EPY50722.1 19S proteasome regulatory subunit Rpn6 [Schizosaccharomyces cryophilus OY26]
MSSNASIELAGAELKSKNYAKAEVIYKEILQKDVKKDESLINEQEQAMVGLSDLYVAENRHEDLAKFVQEVRPLMSNFSKAKAAKIIRTLIDKFSGTKNSLPLQIEVTKSCREWAIEGKRTFLRQALDTKLISLYYENSSYTDAIDLANTLLFELKRMDDKMLLTEVHLLESRVYHAIRNIPKARASLTAARTAANAIYCPAVLQASLDMQSGILHAEEADFKTAYSYFYEAYEGYNTLDDLKKALSSFKYMLLSQIMLNSISEVKSLLTGKHAVKYSGKDIDAMRAVAQAHENRSLAEFEKALQDYKLELASDPIIRSHLSTLYDNLLEQNLLRVVEPYSRIEVSHIAKLIGLSTVQVEGKLSQMILDKVFYGILDQGSGVLIVFDEPQQDKTYEAALEVIKNMGTVVDLLIENKATALL